MASAALRACGALILAASLIAGPVAAAALPNARADRVYGQWAQFWTGNAWGGMVARTTLNLSAGVAVDAQGGLYSADFYNNRVLHYLTASTAADRVYGQGGDFNSSTANLGGVSPNSLTTPGGVVVDAGGGLYVADSGNNRVLHYPTASTTADRVYGQGGSFSSSAANLGGVSANSLNAPGGVVVDAGGGLYIADSGNNRVLHYPTASTTADRVYGQGGSFSSNAANLGGVSANSLNAPGGVVVDAGGGLYVADQFNNRVLHYPTASTTADRVYGQGGNFSSNAANLGGVSANSLGAPGGVVVDAAGGLYVADSGNNRALHYPTASTTADRVYGQGGSFTSNTANLGGVSAKSLNFPSRLALEPGGGLYAVDQFNSRVLHYRSGSTSADVVYGQWGQFWTGNQDGAMVTRNTLFSPEGVVVDTGGGLYLADSADQRVFHYASGSTVADLVYGQGASFISHAINLGGVSANSLDIPTGLALDAGGGLYVADSGNHRVLHFPTGSTTADRVYGQGGSFASNGPNLGGVSGSSLNNPVGLAVDTGGGLYIVDAGNNRVLHYPPVGTTADRVYGQGGSFTSNRPNRGGISASSLDNPFEVALDSGGALYIADASNNRVLHYPAVSTTADVVYGQAGSFTSNTVNMGGVTANSLFAPHGLAAVSGGGLYIADAGNNRALHYPSLSATADAVYGQGGSFTSNQPNVNGTSAISLFSPFGVALDSAGGVYLADTGNNRALYFAP